MRWVTKEDNRKNFLYISLITHERHNGGKRTIFNSNLGITFNNLDLILALPFIVSAWTSYLDQCSNINIYENHLETL